MTQEQSQALSVSGALALAKRTLEALTIRVVGEVCEISNKPGYKAVYFSIKDEDAVLPCMMWNNRYVANGVEFKLGDKLELVGKFSLYAAKGRMSFDVISFTLAGEGDLRLRVARLAKKLETEGLMAPERKRRIPKMPERIGVVTSPRGAACHDVFRTLKRRFPLAEVRFAGVPVEGPGAPANIISGIRCLEATDVEVILVVRGGGSYEDLMPYNDEALARCIAGCRVPVVTGIGHEPDTTIADMVADLRASTPTAAAEAVSPARAELEQHLAHRQAVLGAAVAARLAYCKTEVDRRAARPVMEDPARMYDSQAQFLDDAQDRLEALAATMLDTRQRKTDDAFNRFASLQKQLLAASTHQFQLKAARLDDLSPLRIISRGFALVHDGEGGLVTTAQRLEPGDAIRVTLADGDVAATVTDITRTPAR